VTGVLLVAVGLLMALPTSASARVRLHGASIDPVALLARWRHARHSHSALIEVLSGLRDELRSGGGLREAFERAASGCRHPAIARAVATSRLGGDVPAALQADGEEQPVVLSLAALWEVSEGSGAALAGALDRLVAGAEQAEQVRREVGAQLAGPRATVRVLALLPLIGLGMGLLMGADPVGFLLGTPWGWACLVLAALLEAAGLFWMRRLVSGIEAHL
jgi:tight adherence protein B